MKLNVSSMKVNIGKGLLSQIEKQSKYGNNDIITLDDLVKVAKEIEEQYDHRVNTRREYHAHVLCKDGKIRNVTVVENKKKAEEWGPKFYYYTETDSGIVPAPYGVINKFLKH